MIRTITTTFVFKAPNRLMAALPSSPWAQMALDSLRFEAALLEVSRATNTLPVGKLAKLREICR